MRNTERIIMTRLTGITLLVLFFSGSNLGAQVRPVFFDQFYCFESVSFDSTYPNDKILFLGDEDRFTPSNADIQIGEEILLSSLQDSNKMVLNIFRGEKYKNLKKYRRQYYGVISEDNRTILVVYMMNFKHKRRANRIFSGWESDYIYSTNETFTKNVFLVFIDLEANSIKSRLD